MDEIKTIKKDRIFEIALTKHLDSKLILKDYYITRILYLLKDLEGVYFKGGTAIQKILLEHSRISEDIDFTLTHDLEEVKKKITEILLDSKIFDKITKDKDVKGFTRLIVHYKGFDDEEGTVFIDLNARAKLMTAPEKHKIKHFYEGFIPEFSMMTLAKEEMIAEKIAATIGRNKPRDHYDLYKIISAGIPINLSLVKKKCEQSGVEFDIIKMFNQAKKLKNRWDEDLIPLLSDEISFEKVMKTLARYFKLKEEKDKKKT